MNEFEKIKNDVLVENNAQFIFQHIKELENDLTKHGRRWFWELLQNAKDARKKNENIIVETLYESEKLIFRHTGKGFTREEIAHLIFHGSTKNNDVTKTGKFGTGFMATHLLSRKVTIKGKLSDNNKCFEFVLDRNGDNVNKLQEALEQSWERFENSEIKCDEDSNYNTQFTYEVNYNKKEIVDNTLKNLDQTVPFVLSSNSEIQEVKISNNGDTFSIKKEKEENNDNKFLQDFIISINEHKIQILKLEKEFDVEIKYKTDNNIERKKERIKVSVNIELDGDEIKEMKDNVPRFFYDFPLFTTESFNIPIVINSLSFKPKVERDGIYLGQSNTYDVKKNKIILSKSFELFLNLIDELIKRNTKKIYLLLKIKRIDIPDVDNDWLNKEFGKIIEGIIDKNVIRNNKNELIKLSEAIIPLLSVNEIEHDINFWLLVKEIFPKNIVLKENYQKWISIVREWKSLINERFEFEKNIEDIAKIVENETTIEQFSEKYFNSEKTKAFQWLNNFYKIIDDTNNIDSFLENYDIVPNQNGIFVKRTSEIKLDQSIDEELKNILKLLGEDIKDVLIDKEITYFKNKSTFSNKTQQEVYEHTISEVKKISDNFKEQQFEASKRMLKWLLTNNIYEPLEGFPISVNLEEEKRKVYKLSSNQKLLAPISLWKPECFQKYANIFNNEFIINEEYSQIIKDDIHILESKGYIYLRPLYNSNLKFKKEDLQKVVSGKIKDNFWTDSDENSKKIEIPEILVSQIAYFVSYDKSIIQNSRKSKKQTQLLLEFIFNCILCNDNIIFDVKELKIGEESVKIYPSYWLAKLKSNQWVNVGKDKYEAPTSTNLYLYFETSDDLREKLKDEKVAKLLNIIGVSVGDLTKNIYAKTDEEKLGWDKVITSVLSIGHEKNISPAEIQNIFNDEQLIEEIRKKYKEKNIVKNNRDIGLTVECIFQEIIKNELSDLNIQITKVIKGRDFDIEYDFIENGEEQFLSLEYREKKYSIELKSTRINYIRMTKEQGALSTEKPDYFALCVLKHDFNLDDFRDENGNINKTIRDKIKNEIRFVTDIGRRLSNEVKKVKELDKKVKETRLASSEIEVDIEEGEIKYKINEKVWKDALKLNEFINYLKNKFE